MSDEEKEAVSSLKTKVADLIEHLQPSDTFGTDFDYLRWLQGFNFDQEETTRKLRHHLRFRAKAPHLMPGYVIDRYSQDAYFFICPKPISWSKSGLALMVEIIGYVDVDSFVRTDETSWTTFLTYVLFQYDKLMDAVRSREADTGVQSGIHLIWDLDGLDFSITTFLTTRMTPMTQMVHFFQSYFVEALQKITVINAPSIFQKIYAIASPVLPEKTRNKVKIVSTDYLSSLLEDFDIEDIPEYYRGKRKIDESDKSQVIIPPSTLPKAPTLDLTLDDYTKISLSSGKTLVIIIPYTDEYTLPGELSWSIRTNGGLNFAIFVNSDNNSSIDSETDELVFPEFCPLPTSELYPDWGTVAVTKRGFYKVRLVNNNSWIRSATTIHFKITCKPKDSEPFEVSEYEII